jgi:hypothetical protein
LFRLFFFIEKNPSYLILNIGRLTEKGLKESWLSGTTQDPQLIKVWKKIAQKLKNKTSSGLWAVNPMLNTKAFYKNVRFTVGASDLSKKGTKLLPTAGWTYYVTE